MQRLVVIITVLLFTGCTMPQTKIFSLSVPAVKTRTDGEPQATLVLMVESPRYLAQPYIAQRRSPYEIDLSRYAKWEAPPKDILSEVFQAHLFSTGRFKEVKTSRPTQDDHLLKINLRRFEGLDEGPDSYGQIILDAELSSPGGERLYHKTVTKKARLDGPGFVSLAMGLSAALAEASSDVTADVVRSLKPDRP